MADNTEVAKVKLPTMQELCLNPEEAFKNDQFKLLLNQEPPSAWVRKNSQANDALYLPIDKTEFLLDKLMLEWKVEVLSTMLMVNSVLVTVRVHYRNPTNGEWMYHDGTGAKNLQMNKGANPTDITQMKGNAVMMAAPMAKSAAIKDATHHLGRIFGRDLNRQDVKEYTTTYGNPNTAAQAAQQAMKNKMNNNEG